MEITAQQVESRYQALAQRWAGRNSRMDEYEKLYLLDMWEDEPEPDERRISAPVCWEKVESFRTLLLTRPPCISVPASEVKAVAADQADSIEKYLYGVWRQARVGDALNLAEFYASCLGEGVLRCVYDPRAVEGESPLVVQALDPRSVFACPSGRGADLEIVHAFKRTRREIEVEWGVELDRAGAGQDVEDWLDDEVEFIDYWREDRKEVEEEVEVEEEEPEGGVLARLVAMARKALEAGGAVNGLRNGLSGGEEEGEEGEEGEPEGGVRKVWRRQVTNAVVVEGQFIREPRVLEGYKRLPFIRFPGIATPLAGENGALSVLFPITGGVRKMGAVGLAGSYNQLLAMEQQVIETFANGAIVTDQEDLEIDFRPRAINYVRQGKSWKFLVPPGPLPAVRQQMDKLEQLMQDATVSASMAGRYVGQLSGLALSALNNPVLMKIAHRQQIRERAYEQLNEIILMLTEFYAEPEGWYVWGADRAGVGFELRLRPDDIGGYYRNTVELSASLPKDEAGEIMALAQLVGQKLISRETFLDQLQRTKRLSSQSPQDEMKRILRDSLLFEGPTAEKLAQVVLADYSEELAAALAPTPTPTPPGPPQGGGGGAGPMGGGPMGGMPPGVVPPGAVPPAVGAGGPEQMAAMMAMMGSPPPAPPTGGE